MTLKALRAGDGFPPESFDDYSPDTPAPCAASAPTSRGTMRRVSCDQFEFEPPDSEQSLELAIASPSGHCPDLRSLLRACRASSDQRPAPKPDWSRWPMIAEHLARFGALKLPRPTDLREVVLLRDDWNDLEVGLAFGRSLVWYHWSTSA